MPAANCDSEQHWQTHCIGKPSVPAAFRVTVLIEFSKPLAASQELSKDVLPLTSHDRNCAI
jgi:hypothetical protein